MTTVSAVIFLVTADYELATTYIVGRVEQRRLRRRDRLLTVLIVLMLAVIVLIQFAGRRAPARPPRRAPPIAARSRHGRACSAVEFRDVTKRYGTATAVDAASASPSSPARW